MSDVALVSTVRYKVMPTTTGTVLKTSTCYQNLKQFIISQMAENGVKSLRITYFYNFPIFIQSQFLYWLMQNILLRVRVLHENIIFEICLKIDYH